MSFFFCFNVNSSCDKTDLLDVWHRRLGHANSSIMKQVLQKCNILCNNKNSLEFCDACALGKTHNLPFSKVAFDFLSEI